MNELKKNYVSPRIEVYELENENFIAASSQVVNFGNGDGGSGGWSIQKGGGNSTQGGEEEELL